MSSFVLQINSKRTTLSGEQRIPRILVVDDMPGIRAFVSEALRILGYEVRTAAGSNEALALMASTPFKLVLCDLRLPGVRSLEFIDTLQRVDPGVAVIILTGVSLDDPDVRRLREGGIAVLHKPVQVAQLNTTIAEALGNRSA